MWTLLMRVLCWVERWLRTPAGDYVKVQVEWHRPAEWQRLVGLDR